MPNEPESRSKGHVAFVGQWEFIRADGVLYQAPRANPLDLDGYRQGARFECEPRRDGHRAYMRDVWGVDLPEE